MRLKILYAAGAIVVIGVATLAVVWLRAKTGEEGAVTSNEQRIAAETKAVDPEGSAEQPPAPQTPPAPTPAVTSKTPGSILNLSRWKLTLPVDTSRNGNPDEVLQPELNSFSQTPYFQLNGAGNAVLFRAHAGGATTRNSGYPRSELREMAANNKLASWSNTSGTHTMTIRQAITYLPAAKPEVVAGQIHDAEDDVIMIRLQGTHLFVEADGDNIGSLDTAYKLGTPMTIRIVASGGRIKVSYNDTQKVDYAKSGSGFYFKAGCYTQSNPSKGDASSAYGEVAIFSLQLNHT